MGEVMKKRNVALFLAVAFMLVLSTFAGAADITTGINDEVVVAGEPPVSGYAVDCHIRLLEFVLGTRMTVAQKETFLKAIKDECAQMNQEDRESFLQAIELVDSMAEMDAEQHETVRKVLEKDFQEGAAELTDDPAAQQYLKLQNESFKPAIEQKNYNVTNQSLEAFAEYLAFIAQPDQPTWFDAKTIDAINVRVKAGFAAFSEDERQALDDFQLTWYLIRAAWQGVADAAKKDAWRKSFAAIGVKAGETPDSDKIKAALSTDVYADLLDEATRLGIKPLEWSASTTIRIW